MENGEISAGVRSLHFHLALVAADAGLAPALSLFASGGPCGGGNLCLALPADTHSCSLLQGWGGSLGSVSIPGEAGGGHALRSSSSFLFIKRLL